MYSRWHLASATHLHSAFTSTEKKQADRQIRNCNKQTANKGNNSKIHLNLKCGKQMSTSSYTGHAYKGASKCNLRSLPAQNVRKQARYQRQEMAEWWLSKLCEWREREEKIDNLVVTLAGTFALIESAFIHFDGRSHKNHIQIAATFATEFARNCNNIGFNCNRHVASSRVVAIKMIMPDIKWLYWQRLKTICT